MVAKDDDCCWLLDVDFWAVERRVGRRVGRVE